MLVVDPEYGYRLLREDEAVQIGDSYWVEDVWYRVNNLEYNFKNIHPVIRRPIYVGKNFRLLGELERLEHGDEYLTDLSGPWLAVNVWDIEVYGTVGQRPAGIRAYRRVEIGEGYSRIANGVKLISGDEYFIKASGVGWHPVGKTGELPETYVGFVFRRPNRKETEPVSDDVYIVAHYSTMQTDRFKTEAEARNMAEVIARSGKDIGVVLKVVTAYTVAAKETKL